MLSAPFFQTVKTTGVVKDLDADRNGMSGDNDENHKQLQKNDAATVVSDLASTVHTIDIATPTVRSNVVNDIDEPLIVLENSDMLVHRCFGLG